VLSDVELRSAVSAAEGFAPQLSMFVVATTGLKDAHLESVCRELTDKRVRTGGFSVAIVNWTDICSLLGRHPLVARTHFPFAITSVERIILRNDVASLGIDPNQLQYSFSREEFVHPRIVEELLGFISDRYGTVTSVDLDSANRSNRFFGDVQLISAPEGMWVEHRDEDAHQFQCVSYFRYRHLGTSKSGIHILHTKWNGGGSGHFNDLCFLVFQTDDGLTLDNGSLIKRGRLILKTLGSIPLGDRYNGSIEFQGDILSVGDDQNSRGCLKEGFSIQVD